MPSYRQHRRRCDGMAPAEETMGLRSPLLHKRKPKRQVRESGDFSTLQPAVIFRTPSCSCPAAGAPSRPPRCPPPPINVKPPYGSSNIYSASAAAVIASANRQSGAAGGVGGAPVVAANLRRGVSTPPRQPGDPGSKGSAKGCMCYRISVNQTESCLLCCCSGPQLRGRGLGRRRRRPRGC